MVVFTCNHCGESLKKNNVDKHRFSRCNRGISISCMDCFKDFDAENYAQHTQCVTELERYSGKDYVPKANQNKGQKKQEAWVDLVRSIVEKKSIPTSIKKILETISKHENIPRKKAKFLNFMQNSFRYMKLNELEEAWGLLEEAMKATKEQNGNAQENGNSEVGVGQNGKTQENGNGEIHQNGNGQHENGVKRKLEDEPENVDQEAVEEPKKKIRKVEQVPIVDSTEPDQPNVDADEEVGKFKWTESIQAYMSAKARNKEVTMKKLRGKIMKKYKIFTGCDWSDKIERKFNKKISKLTGIVVDNERVRLIE